MYGFDIEEIYKLIDEEAQDEEPDDPFWDVIKHTKLDDEEIVDLPVIVRKKPKVIGMICKSCKDDYPFSESNEDDGTFTCWGCRNVKL